MEPPSPYSIPILNGSGRRIPAAALRLAVRATLGRWAMPPGRVGLFLTGDAGICDLNLRFRGVDGATDVLTFPAPALPASGRRSPELGEIVISVEYAERQALTRGAPLADELAYLAVHGALHLCGLDDETAADRRRMQAAMAEMGQRLGLPPDPAWTSVLHAVVEEAG